MRALHRHRLGIASSLLSGLLLSALAAIAEETPGPQLAATTLTNRDVLLPAIEAPRSAMVVSFSRAAGKQAEPWTRGLLADARWDGPIHNVIVLEGAPRFVRSMIRRGLRSDLTAAQQDFFATVAEGADAWRQHMQTTDDDIVHVALYRAGHKCATISGALSPTALDSLIDECQVP